MKDKTAIITGGAQGIGMAISLTLLKEGTKVIIIDKDKEAGTEFIKELNNPGAEFFPCDITNENDVSNVFASIAQKFQSIDFLINNAGIMSNKPIEHLSLEEWNQVIGTNLTGAFLMSKYCIPFLKRTKGAIINITSTRGYMSEKDTEPYSASKGGLLALTHSLAISLGPHIRVNSISPGWIDVSNYKKKSLRKQENLSEADHTQHPAGRVGTPGDVANLVKFLLSGENSFITGQDFIIDGGMTKKMIYV